MPSTVLCRSSSILHIHLISRMSLRHFRYHRFHHSLAPLLFHFELKIHPFSKINRWYLTPSRTFRFFSEFFMLIRFDFCFVLINFLLYQTVHVTTNHTVVSMSVSCRETSKSFYKTWISYITTIPTLTSKACSGNMPVSQPP